MRRADIAIAVVVAMWGGACSGGGPTSDGAGGAGSGGGSSSSGGTGGGAASGGANSSGGAPSSGGATAGGGSASGGMAAVLPADLFPLALGNEWTYVVVYEQMPDICDDTVLVEEVYDTDTIEDRNAFIVSDFCALRDPATDARLTLHDGDVVQWFNSQWQATLAAPVEEGASWTVIGPENTYLYAWRPVPEITVPAGTFQDCWSREFATIEDVDVYCPGVGPVRRASVTLVLELAAYELH